MYCARDKIKVIHRYSNHGTGSRAQQLFHTWTNHRIAIQQSFAKRAMYKNEARYPVIQCQCKNGIF